MPNIGFTIHRLAFSFPWVGQPEGHLYFTPPGQCSSECWPELESCAAPPRGNSRFGFSCTERSSECALRKRYVQLLSGFVGTFGRCCWTCFTIVEMSCNRDSESDRVFPLEGISFVDRESLSWAMLGLPCRDLNFRKPCPRLCHRWEFVNVRF